MFNLTPVEAGNADGVVGDATNEVGGAVQWVNNPLVFRIFDAAGAGLFAKDGVIRVGGGQLADNFTFGGAIDFSDKVVATFHFDLNAVELFGGAGNNVAGLARCAQGNIEHGLHEAGP